MSSSDEYDDIDFIYDSSFEARLQEIEATAYQAQTKGQEPAAVAKSARDRIGRVEISLEETDAELEGRAHDNHASTSVPLALPNDPLALDIINLSCSQESSIEESLVEAVTIISPESSYQDISDDEDSSQDIFYDAEEDLTGEAKKKKRMSLFKRFRKRGFFSVTDLVGPSWCEVQFDYRLRSRPYLPVSDRPSTIITQGGKEIVLNKTVAGSHEKIMQKGEAVHKALEKEIHPVEIQVTTTTREDVWGLKLLNMLASMEALLTLGKCRELPVVGFVKGYMVVGVIDEITRKPVADSDTSIASPHTQKAKSKSKLKDKDSTSQTSLSKFITITPSSSTTSKRQNRRTHRIYVSDSKTRAGGTMPNPENAKSGKMQLMVYKELLDGMIHAGLNGGGCKAGPDSSRKEEASATSSSQTVEHMTPHEPTHTIIEDFSFSRLFSHLSLSPSEPFSPLFMSQSRIVIEGNALGVQAQKAQCLQDMVGCWEDVCKKLGLGTGTGINAEKGGSDGKVENNLELVYRRVEQKQKAKKRTKRKREGNDEMVGPVSQEGRPTREAEEEEDRLIKLAIEESLKDGVEGIQDARATMTLPTLIEKEDGSDDLEPASSGLFPPGTALSPAARRSRTPETSTAPKSDSNIIGSIHFTHSSTILSEHLSSVLGFWMGDRKPEGVKIEDVSRCGWCEFEDGCEWRAKKAEEAVMKNRSLRAARSVGL